MDYWIVTFLSASTSSTEGWSEAKVVIELSGKEIVIALTNLCSAVISPGLVVYGDYYLPCL